MRKLTYEVEEQWNGKKVEEFLKKGHGYSSKSVVKLKKIEEGITVNGVHARTIDILKTGDKVGTLLFDEGKEYILSNAKVDIVYDDEDVIIYNKPPFMPCHTSCGHAHDTLVNVYAKYCKDNKMPVAFRPLNRLDRDTSGAVVCAKHRYAACRITSNFHKVYTAIVCNNMHNNTGTVDMPIKREQEEELKRIVASDGQRAITHYRLVESVPGYDLLEFTLGTGRTHQIRVHMSHIGHPILGDLMYGQASDLINRQALHCKMVEFMHPISEKTVQVHCDIQSDFKYALKELGFKQFA